MHQLLRIWILCACVAGSALAGGPGPDDLAMGPMGQSSAFSVSFEHGTLLPATRSHLLRKRVTFKKWDSRLWNRGTVRAPDRRGNSIVKRKVRFPVLAYPASRPGSERRDVELADIYRCAGIRMDTRTLSIADHWFYQKALEDSERYPSTGPVLSLREINRYQFRRNRPDGNVPVERAGNGS